MIDLSGKGGISHFIGLLAKSLKSQSIDLEIITPKKHEFKDPAIKTVPILYHHHHLKSLYLKGAIYLLSLSRLYFHILRTRPTVVHWHEIKIPLIEWILLKILQYKKIKIVLSAHDILHFERKTNLKTIYRLYHAFDHIIAHTEDSKKNLVHKFDIAEEKITVIPHGEYSELIQTHPPKKLARNRLGLAENARIVLFFGYIRKHKGLHMLVEAFAQTIQKYPESILVIAGQCQEDYGKYLEQINNLGLSKYVKSDIRYIPHESIANYFSAADIVVLPYQHIYQSGILYLAFGARRPVIATRVGGLKEVVLEGKNGFLIPPNDVNTLADTLVKALRDLGQLNKMGDFAYSYAKQNFGWDSIAEKIKRVYINNTGSSKL